MSNPLTRRGVLRKTALVGLGGWLFGGRNLLAEGNSPNEKLNLAVIGCGGRGAANLNTVAASENIVALCDVDERRAGKSFQRYPKAKRYHDFRKLLDETGRQIDAVVVATPNHIHAPASVMAMKLGKHCYCEKPLAHSVYESRVMAEVATKNKLATQMGTQIHAGGNYRRVVELVQSGAIGPVREAHVWIGGGAGGYDRPTDTPPVPAGLNWDLWLGPAPHRPYHPCYVPHDWHYWWDFGAGRLGNFGCHYIDLPFWALKLRHPATVQSEGTPWKPESTPSSQTIAYEFPARGELPPVVMTWHQGSKPPAREKYPDMPKLGAGVLFVGSKGMLLANYSRRMLLPEKKFADFKPPEPTIPDSIGHHKEWIQACKTGSPTTCNFDYSGALTEAVLLGNVAYRLRKKIQWDPVNLKVTNDPEAGQYIRREYREGWIL